MRTSCKNLMVLLAVSVLLIAASTGKTQTINQDHSDFELKAPSKASLYSLLATGLPVTFGAVSAYNGKPGTTELIMISGGLIVGPSMGYIYAGMDEHGAKGIVYRSLFGAGAVLLGDQMGLEISIFGGDVDDDGWPVAIFGGVFLVTHAIIDMVKVTGRVEEYNFQKLCEKEISVNVYPKYFADSGAAGLQLDVNF